ncbi:unnamed protein product [Mytilus edulis]|uniref:Uncharacterized protein n=1 Tax=Mytilus edulis TaxID=6550 RepID=A0A8S3VD43_MYTED|nr:unnamed protein product [Mytilus edulis]
MLMKDMKNLEIWAMEFLSVWKKNKSLKKKVATLNDDIEKLKQYGRRTSLRFHNVPLTQEDLQTTDDLIVAIANHQLSISPPLCVKTSTGLTSSVKLMMGKDNSCVGSEIEKIKTQSICPKETKNNSAHLCITAYLIRHRQEIIKRVNQLKKKIFTRFGPLMVEYLQGRTPALIFF